MKEKETENFKHTQKNIVVGNKMRSVIIIDKTTGSEPISSAVKKKIAANIKNTKVIKKRSCGGCSRKRRG